MSEIQTPEFSPELEVEERVRKVELLISNLLRTGVIFSLGLIVLGTVMSFALQNQIAVVVFIALLGAAGFATVPPLQMWVLEKAHGAGQSVAASFNIAAFNLGNALGAWLGGLTIDHGPGLAALSWVGALLPIAAIATALLCLRLEREPAMAAATVQQAR